MSILDHLNEFHGLPAFDVPLPDKEVSLPAPDAVAWRISAPADGKYDFDERFHHFLTSVAPHRVRALIIGQWDEIYESDADAVIEPLLMAKDRLTSLEAVFIGDMTAEESEISWIEQSDVTPLLHAYPGLRELSVRGGSKLSFPAVTHANLRTLRFETGGLPGAVVRGVAASDLPALEHLEMWLGVENYGGDATVADLAPILSAGRFPALRHLGVQNSEIQDEIAVAMAAAPVVAQLESLALSMGVLTDEGAAALLDGQPLTHLQRLDLDHNWVSAPMEQRLRGALEPSGVKVEMSVKPYEYASGDRYTAASE
ncbi:STM4015 family protein [Streptomyces iranensis]|uniref:STM4015 family protein n=1 Tax=Streptomyces iranensis TaxID=576784 RepID=UPI0039B7746D